MDIAVSFSFLAIILLLAGDVWLILGRRPHRISTVIRTLVYIVFFILSPQRLSGSSLAASVTSNQAMETGYDWCQGFQAAFLSRTGSIGR